MSKISPPPLHRPWKAQLNKTNVPSSGLKSEHSWCVQIRSGSRSLIRGKKSFNCAFLQDRCSKFIIQRQNNSLSHWAQNNYFPQHIRQWKKVQRENTLGFLAVSIKLASILNGHHLFYAGEAALNSCCGFITGGQFCMLSGCWLRNQSKYTCEQEPCPHTVCVWSHTRVKKYSSKYSNGHRRRSSISIL